MRDKIIFQSIKFRSTFRLIACLFFLATLLSCSEDEEPQLIQIEGVVVDSQTLDPVVNAKVTLLDLDLFDADVLTSDFTDQSGNYRLETSQCGVLHITVEKLGYIDTSSGLSDVSCTADLQVFNFRLDPVD